MIIRELVHLRELNLIRTVPCYSMDLDGVNEYIEAPINAAFDLDRFAPMSFEVWVKFVGFDVVDHLISKYQAGKGLAFSVFGGSELRFDLQFNGNTNLITKYSTAAGITTGIWYHLAATYDGSSLASGVKMYKNGVEVAYGLTIDALSSSILNLQTVKIGAFPAAGFYSEELFNKARWWDVELTAGEILTQYNSGKVLTTPVQAASLILDTDINNSTWNGAEYDIPDLTGITAGYQTVNAEEADRIEDCP